jgi:hypothetical protein
MELSQVSQTSLPPASSSSSLPALASESGVLQQPLLPVHPVHPIVPSIPRLIAVPRPQVVPDKEVKLRRDLGSIADLLYRRSCADLIGLCFVSEIIFTSPEHIQPYAAEIWRKCHINRMEEMAVASERGQELPAVEPGA